MAQINKAVLILHHDVDEETGHFVAGEKKPCSQLQQSPVANYEEREACKEKEIYLDEKLVAAQSVLRTVMRSWWPNSGERTQELQKSHHFVKSKRKMKTGQNRPSIYMCRRCWSLDSENESYTRDTTVPGFRSISVAYT